MRLGIYYLRKSVFLIFLNNHLTDYYTMTYCLKRKSKKRFFSFQSMPNLNFAELILSSHKLRAAKSNLTAPDLGRLTAYMKNSFDILYVGRKIDKLTICSVILMGFEERTRPLRIRTGRIGNLQVVNHEVKSVSQRQYAV